MSRVAKKPISVPSNISIGIEGQDIEIKGPKGAVHYQVPDVFLVVNEGNTLSIQSQEGHHRLKPGISLEALAGTTRANLNNIVLGVSTGYEKKLVLVGIGFRGQIQGGVLQLSLGFSHPVLFKIPAGITIEMPIPTEIVIRGIDKHLVGQVAAKIRAIRSVEPYKGKGVRYENERVILKETKKK